MRHAPGFFFCFFCGTWNPSLKASGSSVYDNNRRVPAPSPPSSQPPPSRGPSPPNFSSPRPCCSGLTTQAIQRPLMRSTRGASRIGVNSKTKPSTKPLLPLEEFTLRLRGFTEADAPILPHPGVDDNQWYQGNCNWCGVMGTMAMCTPDVDPQGVYEWTVHREGGTHHQIGIARGNWNRHGEQHFFRSAPPSDWCTKHA